MIPNGTHDLPPGKLATVVTYLEMRQRPPATVIASGERFTVRRVAEPDANWYRDIYQRVGEEWLWQRRLLLSHRALLAIIRHPDTDILSLESDGKDKGFIELNRRSPPDIEIVLFGITSDLFGKGAGRLLLASGLDLAWSYKPSRVWLTTCSLDHPRALQFYQTAGFVPYKRAVEIEDDPRVTGVLPGSAAARIPLL